MQQQQQQQQPSTMLPNSVLFSGSFHPTADMLTLDAKWDNSLVFNADVSTAQHTLSMAKEQEHSRSTGRDVLYRLKHNLKDEATKQQLDAVLAEVQQELSEQGAINSALQAGISDSLDALGAYMRGLPAAHREHQLAEQNLQDRPKGAILQQPPGVEMAGGFSVPAADERPGDMGTSEYLSTLAPKLLRLQNLRQHPFAPRDAGAYMQWEPSQTEGLKKLQQLVTHWPCEPRQRLELEAVLNQLHWEYWHKHDMCRRLWTSVAPLGMWLQYYSASTLVLRWHTRWLAGEQVDQPAEWLYSTLRSAASPSACVNYQLWLHPATAAPEVHSTSTAGSSREPAAVQGASFCIASGQYACQFMWRDAPKSHNDQVPAGVTAFVFEAGTWHSPPLASSSPLRSTGLARKAKKATSPKRPKPQANPTTTCSSPARIAAEAATGTQASADPLPHREQKPSRNKTKRPPGQVVAGSKPDSRSSKPAPDTAKIPAAAPVPSPSPSKRTDGGDSSPARAASRRTVGSTTAVPAPISSPDKAAMPSVSKAAPGSPPTAKGLGFEAGPAAVSNAGWGTEAGPPATSNAAQQEPSGAANPAVGTAVAASAVSSYAAAAAAGKERAAYVAPKAPKAPRRVSTHDTPASRRSSGFGGNTDSWGNAAGSFSSTWADTDSYRSTGFAAPCPTSTASSTGSWSIGTHSGSTNGGQRAEGSRSSRVLPQWQRKSAAVVPAVQAAATNGP